MVKLNFFFELIDSKLKKNVNFCVILLDEGDIFIGRKNNVSFCK